MSEKQKATAKLVADFDPTPRASLADIKAKQIELEAEYSQEQAWAIVDMLQGVIAKQKKDIELLQKEVAELNQAVWASGIEIYQRGPDNKDVTSSATP